MIHKTHFRLPIILCAALCLSSCVETFPVPDFFLAGETYNHSVDDEQDTETHQEDLLADTPRTARTQRKVSSEKLLKADSGQWGMVEKNGGYDPAQMHMEARKRVDTRRRSTAKELAPHFQPDAQSGNDGKFRVLRLEKEGSKPRKTDTVYDEFSTATTQNITSYAPNTKFMTNGKIITPLRKPNAISTTIPTLNTTAIAPISPLQEKAITHDDDIIRPPEIPVLKRYPKPKRLSNIPVATPQNVTVRMADNGIPMPAVKPIHNTEHKKQAKAFVSRIRAGRPSDNVTRLVLETSTLPKYKVALDDIRNVLRIKINNTDWNLSPQSQLSGSDLVSSYVAKEDHEGATLLDIRLTTGSKIIQTMTLRPNERAQYRIVVDLDG